MPTNPTTRGAPRLDGWKEIAAYLRRDVRTVQRWEKREHLPVHRHLHGDRGTVYASAEELDAWWAQRSAHLEHETGSAEVPEAPLVELSSRHLTFKLLVLAAIVGVLGSVLVVWRFRGERGPAPSPPLRFGRLLALATGENGHLQTIPVGHHPHALLLSATGDELYVANYLESSVSVVRTARGTVSRDLPVVGLPVEMVLSSDGRRLFVGGGSGDVSIIQTTDYTERRVTTGGNVSDILLTPDDSLLYLAMVHGGLKRLWTATGTVEALPSVACPVALAMEPRTSRLFVGYQCQGPGGSPGHDVVEVLDLMTARHLATIGGLPNVGGAQRVSPSGAFLWMSGGDACLSPRYDHAGCPVNPGSVTNVIRLADLSLVRSLGFRDEVDLIPLAFSPSGTRVALAGERGLRIMDATNFSVLEQFNLRAEGLAFAPRGRRAYASLPLEDKVAVLEARDPSCELPVEGSMGSWTGDGMVDDVRADHDGIWTGEPAYAPGAVGQAFQFNGSGRHLDMGPTIPAALTDTDATFMAWVKSLDNGTERTIMSFEARAGKTCDSWRIFKDARDRFTFCAGGADRGDCASQGGAVLQSASPARVGAWYHLAARKRGANLSWYVNGNLESSAVFGACREGAGQGRLMVGGGTSGNTWNGLVDEVAIYQRALDDPGIRKAAAAAQCR